MDSIVTLVVLVLVVVLASSENIITKALAVIILVIDAMCFGGSVFAWIIVLAGAAIVLRVSIFLVTGRL